MASTNKFCTNCGASLQSGQAFCAKCGHAVAGTTQPAGAPHAQSQGAHYRSKRHEKVRGCGGHAHD